MNININDTYCPIASQVAKWPTLANEMWVEVNEQNL